MKSEDIDQLADHRPSAGTIVEQALERALRFTEAVQTGSPLYDLEGTRIALTDACISLRQLIYRTGK